MLKQVKQSRMRHWVASGVALAMSVLSAVSAAGAKTKPTWYDSGTGVTWIYSESSDFDGLEITTSSKFKSNGTGTLVVPSYIEGRPVVYFDFYDESARFTALSVPDTVKVIAGFGPRTMFETITIGDGVERIDSSRFSGCTQLKSVTFGKGLKTLCGYGSAAAIFNACYSLQKVVFLGDAPLVNNPNIYFATPASLVTYVTKGSTGWDAYGSGKTGLPKEWNGRAIKYLSQSEISGGGDSGGGSGSGGGSVIPVDELTADFDGSSAHTYNGLVYDSGVMCGMVQLTTSKESTKGVKVSGSVILDDGKKQTMKAVTTQANGGYLNVSSSVGKAGSLDVTIGGNGFKGTLGNMTVATANVDEGTGIMSATVKVQSFDAKTGKIVTKSYKMSGVTSGGEAVGTVTSKDDEAKSFEAVIE